MFWSRFEQKPATEAKHQGDENVNLKLVREMLDDNMN